MELSKDENDLPDLAIKLLEEALDFERGNPGKGIPQSWADASEKYCAAAKLDSKTGYLGISRLYSLSCCAQTVCLHFEKRNDAEQKEESIKFGFKKEYADVVSGICDLGTTARFGWPEIALNVARANREMGDCIRQMSEYTRSRLDVSEVTIQEYYGYAKEFYCLAAELTRDPNNTGTPSLAAQELEEMEAQIAQPKKHTCPKLQRIQIQRLQFQ